MAMFEQLIPSKIILDDTLPLSCAIESSLNVKDHTEYYIRVQRGISENTWTISKRYSDFVSLDAVLKSSGYDLPLPPKRVFGKMDREFIAERQQGLQDYLNAILKKSLLANHHSVKKFLDPDNYSLNIQEIALQHISMFFRSEPKWEVIEPIPEIGCRLRKGYFFIKNKEDPKSKYILSWCRFGADKFLDDKDLSNMMKILATFQHANIHPLNLCLSNETSGITIQSFNENGTLRDLIRQCHPKEKYLKKYGFSSTLAPIPPQYIQVYGRQILECLKLLHDKGIPYGHLHAGNVIVENNQCKLLDLANWLIGIPSCYRPYFVQYKKINTLELIDVYCFGQLLYEMTIGQSLDAATCDDFPLNCPAQLRSVLESILTEEACKNGLPTINDLLSHTLFTGKSTTTVNKPQLKIPSKLKEVLKDAKTKFETRLKHEQKVFHKHQKFTKAQAFLMSDDEKKRRRRKMKKKHLSQEMDGVTDATSKVSVANGEVSNAPLPAPPLPDSGVPSPPPPPPPAPPPTNNITNKDPLPQASPSRGALLNSISGFNKGGLKKTTTVDKSAPVI